MSDILLIHGSCHGAWCWDGVVAELAVLGRHAWAINMPGRNGALPPAPEATLSDFADTILAAIDRRGHGPVTLVGHSAGGFSITAAAEAAPDQIAALIHVCAYVPQPGQSLADMRRAGPSQPLRGRIAVSPDRKTFGFTPETAADLFFHDCPDPWGAASRLCPEPVAPQETALPFTARSAALPRHYIRCTNDRVIPPGYQSIMARDFGPNITDMATGHSPFLADPRGLARHIAAIAP